MKYDIESGLAKERVDMGFDVEYKKDRILTFSDQAVLSKTHM